MCRSAPSTQSSQSTPLGCASQVAVGCFLAEPRSPVARDTWHAAQHVACNVPRDTQHLAHDRRRGIVHAAWCTHGSVCAQVIGELYARMLQRSALPSMRGSRMGACRRCMLCVACRMPPHPPPPVCVCLWIAMLRLEIACALAVGLALQCGATAADGSCQLIAAAHRSRASCSMHYATCVTRNSFCHTQQQRTPPLATAFSCADSTAIGRRTRS